MKMEWAYRTGIVLLMMGILENGMAYNPKFPLHRAADVSHTDRLFSQESRSPYIVYDLPEEEELEQQSSKAQTPHIDPDDSPRPVYREHVVKPNRENEPQTTANFRFPPPRNEIHSPPRHQPSIQYGFQPLRTTKERPVTSASRSITEVTATHPHNKTTTEATIIKSESYISTSTTLAPIESSTVFFKHIKQPTVFEEAEKEEETQTREVYSKESPNQEQSEQIRQQNYPQFQTSSSISANDRIEKTRTKTVILELRPNTGTIDYYDPKKKPTTFVLTRTFTDSSRKPKYLYRTAFDGRRAPTNSFTFFQSEDTPKDKGVQYQNYRQPVADSTEHQKEFTTGYEFTIGNNDQDSSTSDKSLDYDEYSSSSDELPNRNQDSFNSDKSHRYNKDTSHESSKYTQETSDESSGHRHVSSPDGSSRYSEGTATADLSPGYFTSHPNYQGNKKQQTTFSTHRDRYNRIETQETSPTEREFYSEIQPQEIALPNPVPAPAPQIKKDRVPSTPTIPGNFGYLSSGSPFGPQNVPGRAGADYPTYNEIPSTNFDCLERKIPGFYADMEAGCQVFHTCDMDMRRHSFMCPNGTIFNQEFFTCDWWYNVKCDNSPNFYVLNSDLFKEPPKVDEEGKQSKKHLA